MPIYAVRAGLLSITALLVLSCAQAPRTEPGPTAAAGVAATTAAPEVALIPRELLFGNPERTGGSISPDGRWLGWIAPRDGVLNVWIAPRANPADARPVTNDRTRGIRGFAFAYTSRHVVYSQDLGGDENFQVFVTELETGTTRGLTPKGSRAGLAGLSEKFPDQVLVSVNDRDPRFFDIARVDLSSGKSTRLLENREFTGFVTDDDFRIRYASKQTRDGGEEWFVRAGSGWKSWSRVPQEDSLTTALAGFTADGRTLYLLDSRGRDTGALFSLDTATGERTLLAEDARADVGGVLAHPVTGRVQAVAIAYLRNEWRALDPAIERDMANLRRLAGDGEFGVGSRTLDDATWVVTVARSDAPTRFYLYDRASGQATPWFTTRPALADKPLAKMWPVEIRSRDGLVLPSYYTLPTGADPDGDGRPAQPVPLVLLVHGGPWARDGYGLNANHQWFANRGYATLSVNFRGSTGFGKAFVNAGDLQWGRKMQDDLLDGVKWAVDAGIALRDKVAITGGSYGGYATLAGMTMTPREFACGLSIVGPSNLNTLLASIPPYWEPIKRQFSTRVGDPETPEGRALLEERSPLNLVDRIERPLLIGQGANDPRVKQAESDQIVKAMQARNIPVTYVLYPDEGHGFARPENRISFNAVSELFFQRCLGGRAQPIGGDFAGSSISVPEGAALLPGLPEALASYSAVARP